MGFLAPKTPDSVTESPRLDALEVTDSAYGRDISKTYGTQRIGGNIIWASPIEEVRTETTERRGGKGGRGGSTSTRIEYEYFASFAVAFGEGVARDVLRIWADTELILNEAEGRVQSGTRDNYDPAYGVDRPYPEFEYAIRGGGGLGSFLYSAPQLRIDGPQFRCYPGSEDQVPDSLIVSAHGDAAPAFRGICYIVFERLSLSNYGNRIPSISAEINFGDDDGPIPERFAISQGQESPNFGSLDLTSGYMEVDNERGILFAQRHMYDVDTLTFIDNLHTRQPAVSPNDPDVNAPGSCVIGLDFDSNRVAVKSNYGLHICTSDTGREIARLATTSNEDIDMMVGVANGSHAYWFSVNKHLNAQYQVGYYQIEDGELNRVRTFDHPAGRWVSSIAPDIANSAVYVVGHSDSELYISYHQILSTGDTAQETWITITPEEVDENATYFINRVQEEQARIYVDELTGSVMVAVALDTGFKLIRLRGYQTGFTGGGAVGSQLEGPLEWITDVPFIDYGGRGASARTCRIRGGSLIMTNATSAVGGARNRVVQIEMATGEISNDPKFAGTQVTSPDFTNSSQGHSVWDDVANTLYYIPASLSRPDKAVVGGRPRGSTKLQTVIRDIATKVGLDPYADVSYDGELGDIAIQGYRVDRQVRASKILEPLLRLHFIDIVDNNQRLLFKARPDTTRLSVREAEFVRTSAEVEQYVETREQESELPSVMNVDFLDVDLDYQNSTAQHRRPVSATVGKHKESLQLPVVMTSEVAKNTAVKRLQIIWAERSAFKFRLAQKFLLLEPADTLDVELNSGEHVFMRVNDLEIGANFNLDVQAVRENPGQYVADYSADGGIVRPPTVSRGVDTEFIPINSPLLSDLDQ